MGVVAETARSVVGSRTLSVAYTAAAEAGTEVGKAPEAHVAAASSTSIVVDDGSQPH